MKRRWERTKWVCSLLFTFAYSANFAQTKPNFVFYITDDVGWNDIGCYGNPVAHTPNIDRLAAEGLQFDNVYLTTSSCSPSRSSLITGRYPHNTGAPELHDTLPRSQFMFPELLQEAGYYTALSGKNHMGPQVKKAFDLVSAGKGPGGQEDWTSLLKNRPQDKPFFFWFASFDAHRPWQIDDKGKIFDPEDIEVPPMLYDGPETRKDLAAYYHEVSRADHYMGQLIKELERQGVLENTYIIFMSDNGRPFPRNKVRLYDSGIKSPFVVYGPGVKKGMQHGLISAVDLAPTILELANTSKPSSIQGRSFARMLFNEEEKIRDFAFAEHNWHVFQAYERMVRFGDWMYIRNGYPERQNLSAESTKMFPSGKELWDAHAQNLTNAKQEDVFLKPRPEEELYYLPSDPYQFTNLAQKDEHRDIRIYLSKVLDQWIKETGDSKPASPTPDRDDVDGNKLNIQWKKREKPGERYNAAQVNHSGPVTKGDIVLE